MNSEDEANNSDEIELERRESSVEDSRGMTAGERTLIQEILDNPPVREDEEVIQQVINGEVRSGDDLVQQSLEQAEQSKKWNIFSWSISSILYSILWCLGVAALSLESQETGVKVPIIINCIYLPLYIATNIYYIIKTLGNFNPITIRRIDQGVGRIRLFGFLWQLTYLGLYLGYFWGLNLSDSPLTDIHTAIFFWLIVIHLIMIIVLISLICGVYCCVSCCCSPNSTIGEGDGPGTQLAEQNTTLQSFKDLLGIGGNGNETKCPICLEEYNDSDQLRQMPCKHYFHQECLDTWLERHNSCPYCRRRLGENP